MRFSAVITVVAWGGILLCLLSCDNGGESTTCDPTSCNAGCVAAGHPAGVCSSGDCECLSPADGDADGDVDADADSGPDADSAGDADLDEEPDAAQDADGPVDADQDAETTCDPDIYPCGPYGRDQCDVIADLGFIPGNIAASSMAGADSQFDLHDVIGNPDTVGILVTGVNGWDMFSATWMTLLPALHEEFGVTTHGRIEFVAAVMDNESAEPASGAYAAAYASRYGIEFPVVADPDEDVLAFLDTTASPVTLLIDATTMRLLDVVVGVNTEAVSAVLRQMDGTVPCPPE